MIYTLTLVVSVCDSEGQLMTASEVPECDLKGQN